MKFIGLRFNTLKHFMKFILFIIISFFSFHNTLIAQEFVTKSFALEKLLGKHMVVNLSNKLYKAVEEGKIKAFKDQRLKETIGVQEIKERGSGKVSTKIKDQDNSAEFKDTFAFRTLNISGIRDYMIYEEWNLDVNNKKYSVRFIAFALAIDHRVEGMKQSKIPLFWVSFDDLTNIFTEVEMKSLLYALYDKTKWTYFNK